MFNENIVVSFFRILRKLLVQYIRSKNLGLSGVEANTNGNEFAGVAGQLILIYICVSEFR
jgi:hypothetical protein